MKLTNTKTSLDKFLDQIKIISEKHDAKLRIGLEATGIYWYSLFSKISEDHKISIYNPVQIHAFAKVNVRGYKTDKIDAKTIAMKDIGVVKIWSPVFTPNAITDNESAEVPELTEIAYFATI